MSARRGAALAVGAGFAALTFSGLAFSGTAYAASCNCAPPPPSCNCSVPTTHQINVPGVTITPPSIYVNAANIVVAAPNVEVQAGSVSVANASASASSTATSSASSISSANAQANALGAIYNAGGGGSSWSTSDSATGYIPNLQVEGVESGEARRICTEMRAVETMVAVQAVCLDDKQVPHPASQLNPDRDVAPGFEGEVYRCIAGARMQYTLAEFHGQANFDHGQTITCQKGEALYHSAGAGLACRPQRAARDCNERSLLRRFGAGIKVLKLARAQQCAAYRTETAKASTTSTMVLDGGVGGVVH